MKRISAIFILYFTWVSCQSETETTTQQLTIIKKEENQIQLTEAQLAQAEITIVTPQNREVPTLLKLTGKLDVAPQSIVAVSVPLGGHLKSIPLLSGHAIKKGQVLATLEDMQYIQLQQDYLTAKANYELASADLQRQVALNSAAANSDKVLQEAKASYETQKVLLQALGQKLLLLGIQPAGLTADKIKKYIHLYAPISGFVSDVKQKIGTYVQPSDIIVELVNPKDILLNLSVMDQDIDQLSIGAPIVAYNNVSPAQTYTGKIVSISKNLDGQQLGSVWCELDQQANTLVPGMFMNGEIQVNSKKGFAVPNTSIVRYQNKEWVFIETAPLNYKMVVIETMGNQNGWTQIATNSIGKDSKVVENGAYTLLMALKNKSE